MKTLATVLLAALLTAEATAAQYRQCSLLHEPHLKVTRTAQLAKDGDVAVARRIAKHVSAYAVERYGLEGMVTDAEKTETTARMYDFLEWKLGSPSAVAAQWVTAGYEHFDKSYVDEAAGMYVGVFAFHGTEPEIRLPRFMQAYLEAQAGLRRNYLELLQAMGYVGLLAESLSRKLNDAADGLLDPSRVAMFVPKSFDLQDSMVEAAIDALRQQDQQGHGVSTSEGPVWGTGTIPGGIQGEVKRLPHHGGTGEEPGPTGVTGHESIDCCPLPGCDNYQAMVDLVAELEARLAELEARLASTWSAVDPQRLQSTSGKGYAGVKLTTAVASWHHGTIVVKVNGLPVGSYDASTELDLAPFLEPGKVNVVDIAVNATRGDKAQGIGVYLDAALPGAETSVRILSFSAGTNRMEETVEVPIL